MQTLLLFFSLLVILFKVNALFRPTIMRRFQPDWHPIVDVFCLSYCAGLSYFFMCEAVQSQLVYQGVPLTTLINWLASIIVVYEYVVIDLIKGLIRLFGGLRALLRLEVQALRRRKAQRPTKTYFRLASPDSRQDPKGFFWIVLAILSTLLTLAMTALFLVSCGKPDKPAQTRPTTAPRDTTRERLQTEHAANLDTVRAKKERTSSTQKPYENAVSQFDSLRARLPR